VQASGYITGMEDGSHDDMTHDHTVIVW
jgi:hypothetical protein